MARSLAALVAGTIVAGSGGVAWAQMSAHAHGGMAPHEMADAGVLGIPSARSGSGTAWLPDDAPVRGWHTMLGGWMVMVHGNAFVGYDDQNGDDEPVSQNWVMAMAEHGLGGGRFHARTML